MKSIRILIVTMLITVFIATGCSMLSFLFPRDINTITAWMDTPAENTVYTYEYLDIFDGDEGTPAEVKYEITDIDKGDNDLIIEYTMENDYGTQFVSYLILDNDEGVLVSSGDKYIDDYDMIYLKTPVEEDNDWYPYDGAVFKYTIEGVNVSKTVEAGTYNDCIFITGQYTDNAGGTREIEIYISPSAGNIVYESSLYTYANGVESEEIVELISIE